MFVVQDSNDYLPFIKSGDDRLPPRTVFQMIMDAAGNQDIGNKVPGVKPRVQLESSHAIYIYQAKREGYPCQVFAEETERTNLHRI